MAEDPSRLPAPRGTAREAAREANREAARAARITPVGGAAREARSATARPPAPDPAGHPVGTGDAAWCRPLLFDPDVDAAARLDARTPLARRPGRRAVFADRTRSLRNATPGLAAVTLGVLLVSAALVGLGVALVLGLLLVATALGVSAAATVRAVRRADRSAAADAARRALRQRLSGQVVDPAALAAPWRQVAVDMARLQRAVAPSEDPRAVAAVEEAAGRVVAAIGADVALRVASDAVRRAVATAPDADADAGALRSRLADAELASAALVSDARAALAEARLAAADARSGDAALESARLRALGDLDRAVIAARALDRGSGEPRSPDRSEDR